MPKDEPVAKEMTYDRIEVDAGKAQAGRPPDVSTAAMKEAVPVDWRVPRPCSAVRARVQAGCSITPGRAARLAALDAHDGVREGRREAVHLEETL